MSHGNFADLTDLNGTKHGVEREETETSGFSDITEGPSSTSTGDDVKSDLHDLPVKVEIGLPPIQLKFSKLKEMSNGSIIPLGIDLTEPVSISISGKKYGSGSLVQLGHKIGVQIERWAPGGTH